MIERTFRLILFLVPMGLIFLWGCDEEDLQYTRFDYTKDFLFRTTADSTVIIVQGYLDPVLPDSLEFNTSHSESLNDTLRTVLGIVGYSYRSNAKATTDLFLRSDTLFVWCADHVQQDPFYFKKEGKTEPPPTFFGIKSIDIETPQGHFVKIEDYRRPH